MKLDMRRAVCVATLVVAATGVGTVAEAASLPTSGVQQQQQQPNADQNTNGQNSDSGGSDNAGLWGLVGLLGLLGFTGLMRRGPKREAMDGYPVAGAGEPPMNTYPPAPPTRTPPGA
jgi:hypothetical protein